MRQHRVWHRRVLKLRKTDYTAGHLRAATTAIRRWTGGSAGDDGFAYTFEESQQKPAPRRRHRGRNKSTHRGNGGNGKEPQVSLSLSAIGDGSDPYNSCAINGGRASSQSPAPVQPNRVNRSAPPLENSSRHKSVRSGSGDNGGGWASATGGISLSGSRTAPCNTTLRTGHATYDGGDPQCSPGLVNDEIAGGSARVSAFRRPTHTSGAATLSTDARGDKYTRRKQPSVTYLRGASSRDTAGGAGRDGKRRTKSRRRHHSKGEGKSNAIITSDKRGVARSGSGSGSGSMKVGARGTDGAVKSLTHLSSNSTGLGNDPTSPCGSRKRGHERIAKRQRGSVVNRNDKAKSYSSSDGVDGVYDAKMDKIDTPLAFLNERRGERVLIQATKPLEVITRST